MTATQKKVLTEDSRIAIAVSGGSDSLATLLAFHKSRGAGGPANIQAVTVDHGLREGSEQEAAMVATLCKNWDIAHTTLTWEGWDGTGNLQDAARRARYQLIAEWGHEAGIDGVIVGHTLNDQAETFLMQLGRKAGLDGLTSMAESFERHGMWFHRPMLGATRDELKNELQEARIAWVDDPSNEDSNFQRVRVRSVLEHLSEAGVSTEAIVEVMGNLRSVRESLLTVFQLYVEDQVREEAGDIIVSVRHYVAMPPEFRRMLLQYGLHWIGGGDHGPRMRSLKKLPVIEGRYVPFTVGGCLIDNFVSMPINAPCKSGGPADVEMRFTREFKAVEGVVSPTDKLWDGRWQLSGPHAAELEVRALGEAIKDCPDWRVTGIPRVSLLSSPAVWRQNELIAAPLAGISGGWTAKATGRGKFAEFIQSR